MKKQQSFEEKMAELEDILGKMAGEETSLQQNIALYAQAAKLIEEISQTLSTAQLKIKEIDEKIEKLNG